jgi:hypothetical protein
VGPRPIYLRGLDVEGVSATITQAAQAAGSVRSAAEDLATLSRDLRAMSRSSV